MTQWLSLQNITNLDMSQFRGNIFQMLLFVSIQKQFDLRKLKELLNLYKGILAIYHLPLSKRFVGFNCLVLS